MITSTNTAANKKPIREKSKASVAVFVPVAFLMPCHGCFRACDIVRACWTRELVKLTARPSGSQTSQGRFGKSTATARAPHRAPACFARPVARTGELTENGMHRVDVFRTNQRRTRDAGLNADICCHTFRATRMTAYPENGGTLENAQVMAAHESPRTTKPYVRTSDEITLGEVKRIII